MERCGYISEIPDREAGYQLSPKLGLWPTHANMSTGQKILIMLIGSNLNTNVKARYITFIIL